MSTYFKDELQRLRIKAGLVKITEQSAEMNKRLTELQKKGEPLPEGVYQTHLEDGSPIFEYYTKEESDLSPEEEKQFIMLKNAACLQTIKVCAIIVAALAAISFALGLMVLFL